MHKTALLIEDIPDEALLTRRAFAGAGLADCLRRASSASFAAMAAATFFFTLKP